MNITADWVDEFDLVNATRGLSTVATLNATEEFIEVSGPSCSSEHAVPCDESQGHALINCYNGGVCCWYDDARSSRCVCPDTHVGEFCHRRYDAAVLEELESRENSMVMAGISSIISLTIGLIALTAFIVLVALLVRKKIMQRRLSTTTLERHLSEIQEELDKMPTITKLIQLTRMTKMFEATVKATAETAVWSDGVAVAVPESLSPSAQAFLPRWSSAPSELSKPRDEPDSSAWLKTPDRRKLQQVFSFDLNMLTTQNGEQDDVDTRL